MQRLSFKHKLAYRLLGYTEADMHEWLQNEEAEAKMAEMRRYELEDIKGQLTAIKDYLGVFVQRNRHQPTHKVTKKAVVYSAPNEGDQVEESRG